jgi:hypothetical protein
MSARTYTISQSSVGPLGQTNLLQRSGNKQEPYEESLPLVHRSIQRIPALPQNTSQSAIPELPSSVQTALRLTPGSLSILQAKLLVTQSGDKYEQEADRIADQVLRQKIPEEKVDIPAKVSQQADNHGGYQVSEDFENRLSRTQGNGTSMSAQICAFVEPRMQFDFSNVQIHTDNEAAQMSQELGARAFTHGRDIYFGLGQYNAQSIEGKRLLTHELTHVVQQCRSSNISNKAQIQLSPEVGSGTSTSTDSDTHPDSPSHPFVHIQGATFQYLYQRLYRIHLYREISHLSPYVIYRAATNETLQNWFYRLGYMLYVQTDDLLRLGGLFCIIGYARKMIQIDNELRRRYHGFDWWFGDLGETRASLARLSNLIILAPDVPRRRRTNRPIELRDPNPEFECGEFCPNDEEFLEEFSPDLISRQPSSTSRQPSSSPSSPRSVFSRIHGQITSEGSIAPGMGGTRSGETSVGGINVGPIGGEAGNYGRFQREYWQDGRRDAESDFNSSNREDAYNRRRRSGRYRGNRDYRIAYRQRWQELQNQRAE